MNDRLEGLTHLIQYRNRREPYWHNMAAFDVILAAELYFKQQRTDADWPFEYRLIELDVKEAE